jgi:dihydropyrimidinase
MKIDKKVIHGLLVVPREGIVRADLLVSEGKIVGICSDSENFQATDVIDVKGKYVFPGIIDCHTHYGLGSPDLDFFTESRSAALGGVTTILTFYQNTKSYLEVFEAEKQKGEELAHVDFSFHLCLMTEQHLREVKEYTEGLGISSFKFFMNFRGDEGKYLGIEGIDDGFLYEGLEAIAKHPSAKAVIHAENIEIGWRFRKRLKEEGREGLSVWTESKPTFLEVESIRRVCYFGKVAHCPIYIAHVTTKEACEELRRLREDVAEIHAETCTHYLTHTKDSPIGNIGKVNPPLRSQADLEYLWASVETGVLDVISTDHVPRKFETKKGNIWECSAGFPGTATLLSILLSEGYHKRGLSLPRIAEVLSENPAKLFNLYPQKGSFFIGSDADLTVVDLDMEKTVTAPDLGSFSDYSLYEGWNLKGWPVLTMVRGEVVMQDGTFVGKPGFGKFIRRYGSTSSHWPNSGS